MNHYYRITAYHKNSNVCLIADSNGKFEKLWQFSSFFVCKGFEIVSVAKEDNLSFGNIPKANADRNNILLRACSKGRPTMSEYLLRARLVLARPNLLFSTENVTNIALSCGFSTSYFNKAFKKYYGVTPLKLRKSK